MGGTPILRAGAPSESIAAFPQFDDGHAEDALSEAPSAFDPADWLATFEAVGGGWIVRDCLSLVIRVEDQPDDALVAARLLVVSLTPAKRDAIVTHLRAIEGRV